MLIVKDKHEAKFARCSGGLLAVSWMDVKQVCILSTMHNSSMTTVKRRTGAQRVDVPAPTAVRDYNSWMGGCDHADQYRSRYCMVRRNVRSYMAIFWWILDIIKINAYALYLMKHECSHDDFLFNIAASLMNTGGKSRRLRPAPEQGVHECVKHPLNNCRRCVVCYNADHTRRSESTFWCPGCRKHVHRECFAALHAHPPSEDGVDEDEVQNE